jgi:hypothetical protein
MLSDGMSEFVASSRPRMWAVYVLLPAMALLFWMGFAALAPDFGVRGRGAFLNDFPPWARSAFFFGCGAVCLAASLVQLIRRFRPRVEVEAGPQGIASHLFWGRGKLAWRDITALEWKGNWLFVRGNSPDAKSKKLVIDTTGIDAPIGNLYAIIAQHRPDLLAHA